jgi:hypothetical protein
MRDSPVAISRNAHAWTPTVDGYYEMRSLGFNFRDEDIIASSRRHERSPTWKVR